ncbi:hypothetical protein D3C81_1560230 [compost metagenome]
MNLALGIIFADHFGDFAAVNRRDEIGLVNDQIIGGGQLAAQRTNELFVRSEETVILQGMFSIDEGDDTVKVQLGQKTGLGQLFDDFLRVRHPGELQ